MVKGMSAPGVFKGLALLFICSGVGLFSSLFLESPVNILLGGIMTFMIAEDWLDQNIDVRLLAVMTAALFYGTADKGKFLLQYSFLFLLFRVLFLWMMRFIPPEVEEKQFVKIERLQMGFLPIFALSFCIVYLLPYWKQGVPEIFEGVQLGYLAFAEQVSEFPVIIYFSFFGLFIFLLLGEVRRRRKRMKNLEEIWPFGDGDVWFLAAWGAAMDLGIFFLIFMVCQVILLFMYAGKFFWDGDRLNE